MGLAIALVSVVAVAATASVVLLVRRSRPDWDEPTPFVRYPTLFGPVRVYTVEYRDGELVRVMELDGAYQSATYLEERCYDLVFDYYKLYDLAFRAPVQVRRMCMLGGGGYAYPKHIVAHVPEVSIDVVEVDPDVTLIAQRWFYLDRLVEEFETERTGRLRIFHGDARAFLEGGEALPVCEGDVPRERYDAILNDCFAGRRPAMRLASVEATRAAKARLAPGGVYLTNCISALEGERAWLLGALVATLREVFAHVYVVPCARYGEEDRDNNMVVASDEALELPGVIDFEPSADARVLRDAELEDYEIPAE